MQVTESNAQGLKREFTIKMSKEDIANKMSARLEQLRAQVRLPGFRPGKVPATLIRQRYGASVMGEVLEQAVQDGTAAAISERSLRPALQPKVEITSFEEGGDLEFSVAVEVLPEIEPIDFSTVELERSKAEVAEESVTATLERMAKERGTAQPVKRKRKTRNGDVVVIDFVGKIDGTEFLGGKAEDYHLALGSGNFIPGFEEQLVGANAGDAVVVKVTFPETYGNKELAGKPAEFDVTVKEVREVVPLEIDDELGKAMGYDTLEALKTAIREEYQREYAGLSRLKLKRALMDALSERHDFAVPEGMVDAEFDGIWKNVQQEIAHGHAPEDAAKPEDELKAEYRAIAERRVRLGLLLAEVGQRNNLTITPEDLNRALIGEARRFPGQEQLVVEYYQKNPEAMESLKAPIYEEKVVDFILEMAKITDKTVSAEELMADAEESETEGAPKPKRKSKAK